MRYRLYFLDEGAHVRRAIDLDCADDAQAIRAVEEHRGLQAMELWQGSRLVKRYPATRK